MFASRDELARTRYGSPCAECRTSLLEAHQQALRSDVISKEKRTEVKVVFLRTTRFQLCVISEAPVGLLQLFLTGQLSLALRAAQLTLSKHRARAKSTDRARGWGFCRQLVQRCRE